MSRHPVPGREELARLADADLERLAIEWRARATRGDKSAFGVAHALEVERRQRIHVSSQMQLPPQLPPRACRWWMFWKSDSSSGSRPPSLL